MSARDTEVACYYNSEGVVFMWMRSRVTQWVGVLLCAFGFIAAPAMAANEKDVDFDWLAANLDKLIKSLAPSFPIVFVGTDNEIPQSPDTVLGDGIVDTHTLAMFGAVLRGNANGRNRVNGITSAEQEAMRLDFVNNRASADNNMRAQGFLDFNCSLLKGILTGLTDCKLTSVLKHADVLGPDVGALVGDLLLDLIAGLLTTGEYNGNDTTGTLGFVNNVIGAAIQAAADALGQGGAAGILIPDFKITNSEFSAYERWGTSPTPTGGTPPRRNAFHASGNLDNGVDANTNLAEYTTATGVREAWLQANGIGVYPTGITNDQPIRITTTPASGVYPAGNTISFPMSYVGGNNATPHTFLWEDARDFGDADATNASTHYGITPLTNGGSFSGTNTTTLTITDLTYATHDNMRPWLRISDAVTIYNTLPRGNGAPAGSAAADGLGGRGTAFGLVKVVEALATGDVRGPVTQCSGSITFTAYASNGDDSADADTDSDPPTYLWFKGPNVGSLVSTGITTNALTIANVTSADAGFYACRVSHFFNIGSTQTFTNAVQLIFPSVPSTPGVPNLADASDTGTSITDNITNDSTPTFTGTTEAGATVTLAMNGTDVGSAVADGSGNYSVTATTLTPNTYSATVRSSNCAGNSGTSTGLANVVIDTSQPTVVISSTPANPTNLSPIPFTITFNESVSNFIVGDIGITGGSLSGFTPVSGTVYTVNATPSAQGAVTLSVGAGVANDAAGNGNTAATNVARTFDNVAPTTIISSAAPSPTNTSPIPFTVTFNENVTGFVVGDIVPTNATLSGFTPVSGTVYTVNATPTAQGTVTLAVGANVAIDAAGNNNTAAADVSRTFDSAAPSVVISSTAPEPTNTSPIPFTITFNETVTGFVIGDIGVTGATLGGFVAVNGSTYAVNATPTGQGTVVLSISNGVATDGAGNANTAAANESRTFDSVQPTTTISSSAADPTNISPIPFTITFSENVANFVVGDIGVTNANLSGFTPVSGSVYTVNAIPTAQGTVTLSVAGLVANDAAGNGNTAATNVSRLYDSAAPTVVISSSASEPTSVAPVPFTVTFNEAVTGFTLAEIGVSSGTPGAFNAVSGTVYTFEVSPAVNGPIQITIAGGVAQDGANNNNSAATAFTRTFTSSDALVTVTSPIGADGTYTNTSPVTINVVFNPTVTGFAASDLAFTNATLVGGSFSGTGTTYAFQVAPTGQGPVNVQVPQDVVATPLAGNVEGNYAFNYDTVAPTAPMVSTTTTGPTSANSITYTVTFNEPVVGFGAADITLLGGPTATIGAPVDQGTGAVYEVTLTSINGDGNLVLRVNSGAGVKDRAGNNLAANGSSGSVEIDNTPPMVLFTSPDLAGPTNSDTINYNVSFSEDVTGFSLSNLSLSVLAGAVNGNIAAPVQLVPDNYTVAVTNVTGDGMVGLFVDVGGVQDAAGNLMVLQHFPVLFTTVDNTLPVFVLNGSNPVTVNCGSAFVDPGATVSDANPSSGGYSTFGDDVNGNNPPGSYTITYSYTDAAGNTGTANRTVVVDDNCPLNVTTNGALFVRDSGTSVRFEIEVHDAIGGATVQWQKEIEDGSKALVWDDIDGETANFYEIASVESEDAGNYRVEVADNVTSVVSPTMVLEVTSNLPVAALPALAGLAAAVALAGAYKSRRRK